MDSVHSHNPASSGPATAIDLAVKSDDDALSVQNSLDSKRAASTERNVDQLLHQVVAQLWDEPVGQPVVQPPHSRIQKLLDQPCYQQCSPEWFEQRKHYLTASAAAAALDIKPYPSYKGNPRLELLQKLKVPDETPFSNRYTEHGKKMSPCTRHSCP